MLEFNNWFFVLVVNFLVLLYILNLILFKPMLKLFKEREDAIDGSLETAKEMGIEKEKAMQELQKSMSDAAQQARAKFEEHRKAGLDKQKESLEQSSKQAAEMIGKARQELKAEADKARASLKSDLERFSDEIVKKLVGA